MEVDGRAGGGPTAPVTVVFSHGFTARLGEWDLQRGAVRGPGAPGLWDQRRHGRSGWTPLTAATIDRTGRDLGRGADAITPGGPVVLAGHSMGGMSIIALARQRPELFGTAWSASSCSPPRPAAWSRPGPSARVQLIRRLRPAAAVPADPAAGGAAARAVPAARHEPRALGHPAAAVRAPTTPTRAGPARPGPARGDAVPGRDGLLRRRSSTTTSGRRWRCSAACPSTVVAATHDRLTPAAHGRDMAARIGDTAELVVVPGAGHSVNLTRPDVVDAALLRLLDRVDGKVDAAG